jgi:LuxR family maltose regulon positive regulatory protein
METPLLQTKLYIPPTRLELVSRPRLIEQLNGALHHKLTLISAPAGFGKTTLVSDWLRQIDVPAAWISLDEGDNDPVQFLVYFVTALGTIITNIGKDSLSALQSPQPPPTTSILTALLNEIATPSDRIILVLDDYHLIESQPIHDALTFLLEHLPPQMHLVIATREDPNLPLARLRVRDQLTELRATDLRFTPAEAAEFLIQVMGLGLSEEDLAALETRTEGWIAGLQLAAISMQGHEDTTRFIKSFTGSHHFVLDYLIEEVLEQQSESVQIFLLQTAVLNRLTGSLCDALTGQDTGQTTLEILDRANLFIIRLDEERRWYRYHHLFSELLRQRLRQTHEEQIPTLHRRASEWYEQKDLPSDAVRHALAAGDFERAADLIELVWPAMDSSFQSATWLGWVKALPDELVRTRPVLSVQYAFALLDGGELEVGEARLRDAERWLDTTADISGRPEVPSAETCPERSRRMVVGDEEQFRSLPAMIATARAYHAQALGDVPRTVQHARQALDLLPEGDHLRRGEAASLLGCAYWASGDLEAAHRTFADGMAGFQMAGNLLFAITVTLALADIRMAQGRLHEAASTYEQSLLLATEPGESVLPVTANLYLGLGMIHHEQGDQEAAGQHLLKSEALGEQAALPDWPYRVCRAQARLKEIQGDLDGAVDLLSEAERLHYRSPVPDVRSIAALKTRVWVRQGRLTKALGWVRERGLSVDDVLSYLREFEHVTLARVLIAEYKSNRVERSIHEAVGLLERLLKAAEEGGRTGSVIEILALQALAYEAQGNISMALAPLEHALTLAKPEGYVRIFVDEGQPMARLLYEAFSREIAPDYTRRLLAAFPIAEPEQVGPSKTQSKILNLKPVLSEAEVSEIVESLSERELEVLELIAEGLTNQEVATRLYLSLHTIKVHARNIYAKLGVKNRTQAVAKGKALGILSHT